MIVVDTSAWIDLFRGGGDELVEVLDNGDALLHPFVYGELLLGGLPNDPEVIAPLEGVPPAPVGSATEVAAFIGWAGLAGTGVGYVDAHLLVSARLVGKGRLLTTDRRLRKQATRLGLAA